MSDPHLYAVIMAGGRGERFWPMGRRQKPKQLLQLTGGATMLEETVLRLFPLVAADHVLVITNCDYVAQVRELLPIPPENVIGEPVGRDTAPCVALAAGLIRRRDASPEAAMILLPADHVIEPAKRLQAILARATVQARRGALVTIGIAPTEPATGYGYIHVGATVADDFARVLAFREKPDRATAERMLADGHFLWNSGMFLWTVAAIRAEFERHCPALAQFADRLALAADPEALLHAEFASCPKISIDYAVMEKAADILVAPSDFRWNDIGSWDALRKEFAADAAGNIQRGRVAALECENCVVVSDDAHLCAAIGMRDVAMIHSGNATLVCPIAELQKVKNLVKELEKRSDAAEYL